MTSATIKSQKITYAKDEVIKAGETYTGGNGATVIVKNFYEGCDGELMIAYSALNAETHEGWAAGDTTPNTMYHWIFPEGRFSGKYKAAA